VRDIAAHDWALADDDRSADEGAHRLAAHHAGKRAQRIGQALLAELEDVLTSILADRVGRQLDSRELGVFFQLAVRLARPNSQTYVPGLQVCEWCDHVFRAHQRNARRCAECRGQRAPKLRPIRRGGVHVDTDGDPADGPIVYIGRCRECRRGFNSRDVRQELCDDCGSNAGRQRRHRERQPAG
jgi:hypothetical protein